MTIRDPGLILGGPDQYDAGDLAPRPFNRTFAEPYFEAINLIEIDSMYIDPYTSGGIYVYSSSEKPSEFTFSYCQPADI